VVGTAVRLVGISPIVERNEGVQIDIVAAKGMLKVAHNFNSTSDSCWSITVMLNLILARSVARTEKQCTSLTCPPMTGRPAWMRGSPA
jgi:hypothetical protein